MTISGVKIVATVSITFAAIFVIFGGFFDGYSFSSIIFLSLAGLIFGAIAAPLIEPKAFRYPTLWQISFATTGCLLLAGLLGAGVDGYLLAIALGIIIGFLAPYWVNYITGP